MRSKRRNKQGSVRVARALGISIRQLYYWVKVLRIVTPQKETYGTRDFLSFKPNEVDVLKRMKVLVDEGYVAHIAADKVRQDGVQ